MFTSEKVPSIFLSETTIISLNFLFHLLGINVGYVGSTLRIQAALVSYFVRQHTHLLDEIYYRVECSISSSFSSRHCFIANFTLFHVTTTLLQFCTWASKWTRRNGALRDGEIDDATRISLPTVRARQRNSFKFIINIPLGWHFRFPPWSFLCLHVLQGPAFEV